MVKYFKYVSETDPNYAWCVNRWNSW